MAETDLIALIGFVSLFALAWAGDVCAVVLIAIRAWRLVFNPEALHDEHVEQRTQE